jgi:hypothetical protein
MGSKFGSPAAAVANGAILSGRKALKSACSSLAQASVGCSAALLFAASPVTAGTITWGGTNQPRLNSGDSFTVNQTTINGGTLTISGGLTSPVNVNGTGTLDIKPGVFVTGNVTNGGGGTVKNAGTITGGSFWCCPAKTVDLNTGLRPINPYRRECSHRDRSALPHR